MDIEKILVSIFENIFNLQKVGHKKHKKHRKPDTPNSLICGHDFRSFS